MTTRAPAEIKITLALFLAALLANCIVALARSCCVVCTIRRKLFASLFKTYILDVCSPLCDWKYSPCPKKYSPKSPQRISSTTPWTLPRISKAQSSHSVLSFKSVEQVNGVCVDQLQVELLLPNLSISNRCRRIKLNCELGMIIDCGW